MRGRPSKLAGLAEDDKAKFLELLRKGAPKCWACTAIRMSPQTLDNYRPRAARGEEPYASFIRDVNQAQAEYVVGRLRVIDADAIGAPTGENRERGDNRALKWLLERMFPNDFGWRRRIEHAGQQSAPLGAGPARVVIVLSPKETD